MYLAHKLSDVEPREIGDRFGGRDYTIVVMTCRAVRRLIDDDARQAALFADLETRCRQKLLRGAS
jgi:chromosomal replication initiation ATPase DnaA